MWEVLIFFIVYINLHSYNNAIYFYLTIIAALQLFFFILLSPSIIFTSQSFAALQLLIFFILSPGSTGSGYVGSVGGGLVGIGVWYVWC